jgi:hypothetical protein
MRVAAKHLQRQPIHAIPHVGPADSPTIPPASNYLVYPRWEANTALCLRRS